MKTSESKLLNLLVQDCIIFRFTTEEALDFIEQRFRRVSEACFKHRKARLNSDRATEAWLNDFANAGFAQFQRENIDTIQMLQHNSLEALRIQESKNLETKQLSLL